MAIEFYGVDTTSFLKKIRRSNVFFIAIRFIVMIFDDLWMEDFISIEADPVLNVFN